MGGFATNIPPPHPCLRRWYCITCNTNIILLCSSHILVCSCRSRLPLAMAYKIKYVVVDNSMAVYSSAVYNRYFPEYLRLVEIRYTDCRINFSNIITRSYSRRMFAVVWRDQSLGCIFWKIRFNTFRHEIVRSPVIRNKTKKTLNKRCQPYLGAAAFTTGPRVQINKMNAFICSDCGVGALK